MTPRRWNDGDSDERDFVQEFAVPIDALAARTATCPPLDQLRASREGLLPEPSQAMVSAHLNQCAECQALLRDVLHVDLEVSDDDLSRLRTRVAEAQQIPRARARLASATGLAMAASLAAAVGLGAWVVSLRQETAALREAAATHGAELGRALDAARARTQALEGQVAQLQQPSVALNVPLIDLEPIDALRGGTAPVVSVPRSAAFVTVVLATSGAATGRVYTLDIRGASERVIWTGTGLTSTSAGTVTLVVPRALLPSGDLVLSLTDPTGKAAYRYAIRIVETQ